MIDWSKELYDQLDFIWTTQTRPRLVGLTDEEYFWEPVRGSWSVRGGRIDWAYPAPEPAPVTTIAWRMTHITVGVFGARSASHFGGPPADYATFDYARTAARALDQLDQAYATWSAGVRGLGPDGLERPCGPAEGPYAEYPMATLVLHINREAIHHAAEIALLRDLWAHRS